MSDLFRDKNIRPMLIGAESEPFDDDAYLYELKIDGERCVAYLDPAAGTDLRNKRNMKMLPKVPELAGLQQNVNRRCILDGELAVITDGRPDFYAIQSRSIMTTPHKIQLAAQRQPASFAAFDILYLGDGPTVGLPLTERKRLLRGVVRSENARFAVSRVVEQGGIDFYELVKARNLEGIVAKRRDSMYYFDKRTKDWIKIQFLKDEDFIVCGYGRNEGGMNTLVLGQYQNGRLVYRGRFSLGVGGEGFRVIRSQPKAITPPFGRSSESGDATWNVPELVCTVQYMDKTESGGMRQPVFKGLRQDKTPEECRTV